MKLLARVLGALLALALAFIGWGYWGATRPPLVVPFSYQLKGLPPGTRLKVLLISDTHRGRPDMSAARLDAIMDQANALKPDLILLAGDYIGGNPLGLGGKPHLKPAVQPLAKLRAPLGVFAVLGNHDNAHWGPIVFAAQPSPRLLVNQSVDVGPLVVAGVNSDAHGANVPAALSAATPGKPLLLLRHEGGALALDPPRRDLSVLALAGHTHGGQILLPLIGAPADRILGGPPLCRRGFCTVNGWPLYVTSGVGTSMVPLRIGVPPEMVLITLTPG
ncbi:phosphohydrolase [Sandaracinobacter neustonicus]|uniref:Phosphohydrolase n=1 Tax=Sandaracinobacter neustonicus TaxID=1715348 RepID=A0A501XKJ7_9SPHN|nr:metallophosphoesterase [Sandaracinobacter neustonicus]TPE61192.1 phosphohydrolase [Sandaracinobacter neustonicus]